MAVVKIQSKVKKVEKVTPPVEEESFVEPQTEETLDEKSEVVASKKRPCPYCASKQEPHYYDAAALRRYINDRGRIVGRARSSVCSKHQRRLTKEIKKARHLALLPFTVSL